MSSKWQLSFEKDAASSHKCTHSIENKAGTHIFWWFSYYSNTFHPKYLQTKPYESKSMTVWIWFFFLFCSPFWWAEGKIRHMNILLSGRHFGSFLGWHHTALVERNLCFCVHSPVAQHWLPKELSTVPTLALLSTLTRGYFPLTIRKNSAVRYKMQVKRKVLILRISVA